MRKYAALFFALTLAIAARAAGEEAKPVLRIRPFSGDELAASELAAIQNLVTSYIVELKAFRVVDSRGQELALQEAETAVSLGAPKDLAPLAADYLVTGSVAKAGGLLVFSLDATKVSTGEKRSVSEVLPSINDLILQSKRLTRALFERSESEAAVVVSAAGLPAAGGAAVQSAGEAFAPPPGPAGEAFAPLLPPSDAPPPLAAMAFPSLAKAAGTWKGDKGVERVNLFPDGRGIAVLASGATMKLKARLSGGTIEIVQDQPNLPDFYRGPGIDYRAAKVVAAQARPWRWVFRLSEDGASLFGSKESVFVRIEPKGKVFVDNGYVREAAWSRLFR